MTIVYKIVSITDTNYEVQININNGSVIKRLSFRKPVHSLKTKEDVDLLIKQHCDQLVIESNISKNDYSALEDLLNVETTIEDQPNVPAQIKSKL